MVCIATVRRSATMLPIYHPSRRGKPDAGFALFEGECLKWPGFVEFDDVNGKVLAFLYYGFAYYGVAIPVLPLTIRVLCMMTMLTRCSPTPPTTRPTEYGT